MADRDRHSLILRTTGIVAIAVMIADLSAFAQIPPSNEPSRAEQKAADETIDRKTPRPELTESDLNGTMAFASEHHPELARLLEHLKKSRPNEFQRAMRELHQQVQGLEKLRERNPARHAQQLELWKTDSQIRVLVAKWSKSGDKKLEQEIRELLKQRRDAKLAQLKAERLRLSEQLQKVDSQITSLSEAHDQQLDREWEQLAKKTNANRKVGTKNVQKSPVGSDTTKGSARQE